MKRIQDKLLIVLVSVALIPLVITEYLTISSAENAQATYSMNSLDSILSQKINLIEKYFLAQQERAKLLTKTPQIISSLPVLVAGFNQTKKSQSYLETIEKFGPFLNYYQQSSKLKNVHLIGANGDIVYSVNQGKDSGTNLISGRYNRTQLANIVQQVLKNKQSTHSNLLIMPAITIYFLPLSPLLFISTTKLRVRSHYN